jgi:hypothetical protein
MVMGGVDSASAVDGPEGLGTPILAELGEELVDNFTVFDDQDAGHVPSVSTP